MNAKVYRVDRGLLVLIDDLKNVASDYTEEDYIRECKEDAEIHPTEDKIEWIEYIQGKPIIIEFYN